MLKKFIQTALLLVVLCTTATTYAQVSQAPDGIQFQALATDANGHPAAGRVIYVKDAIVAKTATGTIVYSETFKVTASSAGIFTIVLGKGTYASGVTSIANIDWANGPFFLNLKIAVEPTVPTASWNVNNEYVDLGTSQFWSVPYALYAGNVKGADGKLNTSDTAAMLKPYFTSINLKANIESPTFTGTVSGITKAMVGLGNVDNTADINKPISTATQAALDLKANTADVTTALDLKVDKVSGKALSTNDFTTAEKTKLAAITGTNTGDQDLSALAVASDVNAALALKANTADVNAALASKANGVNVANSLALKADNVTVTNLLATKEDKLNKSVNVTTDAASDTKYPSVKAVKTYVDAQVAGATIADASATEKGKIQLAGDLAGTAAAPTVPGLALKAPIASPIFTGIPTAPTAVAGTNTNQLATTEFVTNANATNANLTGDVTSVGNTATVVKINGTSLAGLSTGILKNTTSTGVPTIAVAGTDYQAPLTLTTTGTGAATLSGTTLNIPIVTAVSSTDASTLSGTVAITKGGTGATSASGALTNLGAAPIASPTFTGTVSAPIYASTPQLLTAGAIINWNPTQGLNASVTLNQNSTLRFTTPPAVGSYGTLVLTQDATGGRTITLPSTTNKVLGSTSSTTIDLSTAANAIDIVNFYYDGTNYFWNIGQGYGTAATSSATNIAGGAAGSIPYQTAVGATSLLAKGTDGQILTLASGLPSWAAAPATGVTSVAMSTPTGLTVTGSPITSSGTLALSMTTGYAIPTTASQTNWDAAYTNRITSATSPLSITSNALSLGTIPVANGGTGATSQQTAINALTGTQSAGKYLRSDGTNAALSTIQAADVPTLNQNTTGNAANVTGIVAVANGGTNSTATATSGGIGYGTGTAHAYTSAGTSGQVLISAGAGAPTWATLTAGSAITITNTAGAITIAAAVRPMTEQVTATSAHAVATATFTLSNTPLNSKVWMFINGVRTNNNAYSVSGNTVTYTAANNNSYTIVAGDRIQFDYAY